MGLGIGGISRSSYDNRSYDNALRPLPDYSLMDLESAAKTKREAMATKKLPNPDPKNFEIIHAEQIGKYLIVHVRYPDCTNYEGIKILVYQDVDVQDLLKQGSLDPHFSDNRHFHSPIARFVPSWEGMLLAKLFASLMAEHHS